MSTYDPLDIAGQARGKSEEDARKRIAREQEIADIRWLMNSGKGRRIVWRLLEFAGVTRMTFSTNALQMAFNEGNRNCGNFLLTQIMTICPEQYVLMLKEHKPKEEKNGDGTGDQSK